MARDVGDGDSSQVAAGSTKTGAMAEWTSRAIAAAGSVVEGGRGGGTGAWRISHRAGLAPGVWQAEARHGGRTVRIGYRWQDYIAHLPQTSIAHRQEQRPKASGLCGTGAVGGYGRG